MGQVSRQIAMILRNSNLIFIIHARYIDSETGRRSDTAHHYIYNQDHNKNLNILVRHRVVRVIFEYVFIFSLLNFKNKNSRIIISIMVGVLVQWELNMSTIPLEEQRALLSHWWHGRHVLLFFLLERSERRLSLRGPALAQKMF